MSSAKSNEAARVGWAEFISASPAPSRDAINAALTSRALPRISERMYRHYRALVRHGCERYVTINELDVTVKAERLRRAS
jgi:hypothetical protein